MATIPERSELEVFVNSLGTITIRHAAESTSEPESMLVVHPDDVSMLMRALDQARHQARQLEAEEHEEITVPELRASGRTGSA